MKKYLLLILILIGVILLSIAFIGLNSKNLVFFKNQAKITPTEKNLPVLKVGCQPPGSLDLAVRTIVEKGWDKEQGFQIELKTLLADQALTALTNNQVDVLSMAPLSAISYINEQQPITFIATGLKASCPFFVKQNSTAKSWKDLKGKKLGTTMEVGPSFTSFKVIMKAIEDIDVDTYFQISHSPSAELLPRLERGEIDAAMGRCTPEGISKAIEELKYKEIGNITDIMEKDNNLNELMLDGVVVETEWMNNNKELVTKFRNLIYKTYAYILNNSDEIYNNPKILEAYGMKDSSPDVIKKTKELVPRFYTLVPWSELTNMQYKFFEYAKKEGLIKNLPSKQELFLYD